MGSKISTLKEKVTSITKKKKKKDGFQIISRSEWQARVPRWREDLIYPALSSHSTTTGTPACHDRLECTRIVQEMQNKHMDEDGLPDIEYSFLIGGDGSVFEGRGWHTISNRSTLIRCVDPENPPESAVNIQTGQKSTPDRRLIIALIGGKEAENDPVMQDKLKQFLHYAALNMYLNVPFENDLNDYDGELDEEMQEIEEFLKEEGNED